MVHGDEAEWLDEEELSLESFERTKLEYIEKVETK